MSSKGFIKKSGIFLSLNLLYGLSELGFNGVAARLPEGSYSVYWALARLFFIITAPLLGIQLVLSKEIAARSVLGEFGKRRVFVETTLFYTALFTIFIVIAGSILSSFLADFLNLESKFLVFVVLIIIACYFPLPLLYGCIQGMKQFYTLGTIQVIYGSSRLISALIIVFFFSGALFSLLSTFFISIFIALILAAFSVRTLFTPPRTPLSRHEVFHSYALMVPMIVTIVCVTILKNSDTVFARNFFTSLDADAYACASLAGSAFFMLSGIFIILVPTVSEENTRGHDPIHLLKKSFTLVIILSALGMMIFWYAPSFVMKLITVGKSIPGSEPLIKMFGFAIVPLSLVFLMANYFLAQHHSGFVPYLFIGVLGQLSSILLRHDTPMHMLQGIIVANTALLVLMLLYLAQHRKNNERAQKEAISPHLAQDKVAEKAFFDKVSMENRRYSRMPEKEYDLVFSSLGLQKNLGGISILEAGCATGEFGVRLAQNNATVIGVDLSEGMIERNRELNTAVPSYRCMAGDLENSSLFPPNTFDAVACFNVLHHFPNIEKVIENAALWLKPNGTVYLLEPNGGNMVNRLSKVISGLVRSSFPRFLLTHKLSTENERRDFTSAEYIQTFRKYGFFCDVCISIVTRQKYPVLHGISYISVISVVKWLLYAISELTLFSQMNRGSHLVMRMRYSVEP